MQDPQVHVEIGVGVIRQLHIHGGDAQVGGPVDHAAGVFTAGIHRRIFVGADGGDHLGKLFGGIRGRDAAGENAQGGAVVVDQAAEVMGFDEGHERLGFRLGGRFVPAGDVGGGPAAKAGPILLPAVGPVAVQVHAVGIGPAQVTERTGNAIRIEGAQEVEGHVRGDDLRVKAEVEHQLIHQLDGVELTAAVHAGDDEPLGRAGAETIDLQRPALDGFTDGEGAFTERDRSSG